MKKYCYIGTTSYLLLQIIDIFTTIFGLSYGFLEINPLLRINFNNITIISKILLAVGFYGILLNLDITDKFELKLVGWSLVFLNLFYGIIVVNNLFQITMFLIYL